MISRGTLTRVTTLFSSHSINALAKITELINFQPGIIQKLAASVVRNKGYAGMNIMFPNKTGLSKWRIHTQHIYRPV